MSHMQSHAINTLSRKSCNVQTTQSKQGCQNSVDVGVRQGGLYAESPLLIKEPKFEVQTSCMLEEEPQKGQNYSMQ